MLKAGLQQCSVSDFDIEKEIGKGSAGQLFKVRSPTTSYAVALKKVWDLNGGVGPSATEFETEQRRDYTVPLRYPHPYVWFDYAVVTCAFIRVSYVMCCFVQAPCQYFPLFGESTDDSTNTDREAEWQWTHVLHLDGIVRRQSGHTLP